MTEKQKKLKAERDRRYREKKKAEKAAEADLQAPVDPAPESAMQSSVIRLLDEQEGLTAFDVQRRRMMREGRR